MGIDVIAASADPLEDAKRTVEELGIEFSLAYGIDVEQIARLTGAFFAVSEEAKPLEGSEERKAAITGEAEQKKKLFLEPLAFLIRPDKTIDVVCYSSGHIGRLWPKEIGSLVKYYKGKK